MSLIGLTQAFPHACRHAPFYTYIYTQHACPLPVLRLASVSIRRRTHAWSARDFGNITLCSIRSCPVRLCLIRRCPSSCAIHIIPPAWH